MGTRWIYGLLACACLAGVLLISGCVCGGTGERPVSTATPVPAPTNEPTEVQWSNYTPSGSGYHPPTAAPTAAPGSGVTATATPLATPVPTPAGPVIINATLLEGGSDKDTYNKGTTAICYVVIKNTGNVRIEKIDFAIDVYKQIFGYMKVISSPYSVDGQAIEPGAARRVEFSVAIPSDYNGVSTSGKYRFDVAVSTSGHAIGSFQKYVTVS